jgi:hypothetical protein
MYTELNRNTFYLVLTARYDPYEEELEDIFQYESEALDYAETTADLYGVHFCKVIKVLDGSPQLLAIYPGRYIKN